MGVFLIITTMGVLLAFDALGSDAKCLSNSVQELSCPVCSIAPNENTVQRVMSLFVYSSTVLLPYIEVIMIII